MSARIAPDTIGAVAPVADYRQPTPVVSSPPVTSRLQSSDIAENGSLGTSTGLARSNTPPVPERTPAPPPPLPPIEKPGADYVRAVISGALAPRPTSAQELFARVGTSWTPPESEYRLTEKIA